MQTGSFDLLTPKAVISSVEQTHLYQLDGMVTPYPSYVNRVFGLTSDTGEPLVVKFYRPGRWTYDAILDEHDFLEDCAADEIPVVVPIKDSEGDTLAEVTVADNGIEETFFYALFPRMGGRNFDAESDDDWYRLGTIVGRCHTTGKKQIAANRETCHPIKNTGAYLQELLDENLVSPICRDDFETVCRDLIGEIVPLFEDLDIQRLHGDCHRGNILDRADEGLVLYDFDDMVNGPAVQDLWLLLPDYAGNCRRELLMLLDGYEQFVELDRSTLKLIEPLRFMRMVYFLVWRARQRHDFWFNSNFPDWGTEAFWIKEVEDLRVQKNVIRDFLDEFAENQWSIT